MKENRMHWVDICRCFFIIAIVVGHVFKSGYLRQWLFSFHVPAFFLISGYCFNYIDNAKMFVKKKVRTIVVPYFAFSIFSILLFAAARIFVPQISNIMECNFIKNVFTMLYATSKPDIMKYNTPLWFLPCFFVVSIVAYVIEKMAYKYVKCIRYIAMFICACVGG
jgi:fucose 4-O-acetylase-like acetyltransferase